MVLGSDGAISGTMIVLIVLILMELWCWYDNVTSGVSSGSDAVGFGGNASS